MCRFFLAQTDVAALRLGLVDDYGKWHLVRIETDLAVAPGCDLHGPQAALGLHFLVVGHTGQRLNARFEAVGLSRQTFHDRLHAAQAGLGSLPHGQRVRARLWSV